MHVTHVPSLRVTRDPTFRTYDAPLASRDPAFFATLLAASSDFVTRKPLQSASITFAEEYTGPWSNVRELTPTPRVLPELKPGELRLLGSTFHPTAAAIAKAATELHTEPDIWLDPLFVESFQPGFDVQGVVDTVKKHLSASLELGGFVEVGGGRLMPTLSDEDVFGVRVEEFIVGEGDFRVGLVGQKALRAVDYIKKGQLLGVY